MSGGMIITIPRVEARGPCSKWLLERRSEGFEEPMPGVDGDPLTDDDLHLALYLCYELHYRGVVGLPDDAEWDPRIIGFRRLLEARFEQALRQSVDPTPVEPDRVAEILRAIDASSELTLARHIERDASAWQVAEFVVHRSAYHLKEADPHTFAAPRLTGAAKAAFMEIQYDEYGAGSPEQMHSRLFSQMMRGLGLDDGYGAYVNSIPGVTLATVNLMSLFGLHRRLRGAAVGHLALFELGSSEPNRLYGNGLRRLGYGPEVTSFHDEHVEADAGHAMIATHDVAQRLATDEPDLADDIVFGARALDLMESLAGDHLLDSWRADRSSLLEPIPSSEATSC
jgi:hypothetical protein